jgi:hypothetical protein
MHQAIIVSSNYSSLTGDREYIVLNPQAKRQFMVHPGLTEMTKKFFL